LNPGSQAAQLVHAAYSFQKEYSDIQNVWYNISNYVALLSCENEQSLKDLIYKANAKGIKYSVFTEPDLNDSLTSIVLEPCEEASKMCSSLQLAFKEYNNHFNALNGKEVACGN
jgi:hypothetical protein